MFTFQTDWFPCWWCLTHIVSCLSSPLSLFLSLSLSLSFIVCSFCDDVRSDVESHQRSSLCPQKPTEWTSGMSHFIFFLPSSIYLNIHPSIHYFCFLLSVLLLLSFHPTFYLFTTFLILSFLDVLFPSFLPSYWLFSLLVGGFWGKQKVLRLSLICSTVCWVRLS